MMKCCVPLCDISSETLASKSRSVFIPKSVTFHGFPTVERLRNLWLTNLGIDERKLPEGAVVCSQHFSKDNFYFTRSNLRKLRYDAVPLEVVPPEAQFCVICLDTGCKLYPLRTQNLHKAYSNLTGISTAHELNNVLKLCAECAQRLINCCKLRDKSLRAHNLLLQLVRKRGQVTTHNVRTINRVENKLTSDLVLDISEPDYFGIMDISEESDVTNKELKPFEGEYLSMKSEISDHNYYKLDDEIDSDVDYEIQQPSEFDDIKTNNDSVDGDECNESRKVMISTSCYGIKKDVETDNKFYGDSDEFEDMHDDIKMNNDEMDNDEFKSFKVKKSSPNYDASNDFETDNDKFYGDSDEFEEMYEDDIKTNIKILGDDEEFNSCKVKKSSSSEDINNGDETYDDKVEVDFEVEYLNNYFGENIEYLQDDYEQVALALSATRRKFIDEKKKSGNEKQAVQKKSGNEKQAVQKKSGNEKQAIQKKSGNEKQAAQKKSGNEKQAIQKKSGNEKQAVNVKHKTVVKQEKPDLKMFEITLLSHEDAVAEIMKRRYEESYIYSPFKCTECYKAYTTKEAFDAHMEHHTEKYGPLSCEVCKTHKWNITQLRNHQRSFHTYKYSCSLCPAVKTNKYWAVMHERWHKGLKYECPHCEAQYSKHATYMQHLRRMHPSDVICPHCGYSFVRAGFENHMREVHPFVDPSQSLAGPLCEECNIVFASMAAYKQHVEVSPVHVASSSKDSDDASRNQAGGESGNQTSTTQKKRPKRITCEECGEKVSGFRRYYHHQLQHGKVSTKTKSQPAMCEQCGRVFKNQSLLRYHMPLHSGRRQFPCPVCGKLFVLKAHLYFHKQIHAPDRPRYECELCGKHFANKMGRVRHIQIIHNSVKYECDRCEKTFTTVFGRKVHVRHVHDKVPYPKREKRKNTARSEPQARRTDATRKTARPEPQAMRTYETRNTARPESQATRTDATRKTARPEPQARQTDATRKTARTEPQARQTDATRKTARPEPQARQTDATRKTARPEPQARRTDATRKTARPEPQARQTDATRKTARPKPRAKQTDATSDSDTQ